MFNKLREPVSGLTHLFGAVASAFGLIILLIYCSPIDNYRYTIAFTIFGVSLILLYTASSVYHMVTIYDKAIKVLRRIDHSMIYVLIAGSYTPIALIALSGAWRWGILITIWSLAVLGVLIKNFWFNAPRWLYTSSYILMGWMVIIAIIPLSKVLPAQGMYWLVAGGITYTVGGVIYATKWPNFKSKYFGFHELFHLFILAGSFCHYWLMLKYVLYI